MTLIDRDKLLEYIDDNFYPTTVSCYMTVAEARAARERHNMFIYAINNAPAVDAVEVIRCKDCLFWTGFKLADGSECEGVCDVGEERCITNSNGYCYWAKRVKNTCG